MQILLHELKKIFSWKILLLLIIINTILYFLLIEFEIKYFPNGRPTLDLYRVGVEMVEKYGTRIDDHEFADFEKIYEAKKEEASRYLQSRKEFVDAGMGTYDAFRNYDRNNKEQDELYDKIIFEEGIDLFWELEAREHLIEVFYEKKTERDFEAYIDNPNKRQNARFYEIKENEKYQLYPDEAFTNFKTFFSYVAVIVILSVVLVISPIFLYDRSRQLLDLQYTMKKGRNLYKTKIVAGLIAAFLVITMLLIIYCSLFSLNNTSMFFGVPINAFTHEFHWYDLTFYQYIALTIIAIYILGFIVALLSMSFSTIMPNYVSLVGIQIPIIIAFIASGVAYLISKIIDLIIPQWMIPTAYSFLVLVSVMFLVYLWKREKKRDIVM